MASAAVVAAIALAGAVPAQANSSRDYFVARTTRQLPPQLDPAERDYYRQLFAAIDAQDWGKVQALFAQKEHGPLHHVARAEYYLAKNSPKVTLEQIQDWMDKGRRLPEAAQLGRLALTRGATQLPDIPQEQTFYRRGSPPLRVRPRSVEDGTMPADVRQAILDRITNDDPDAARALLDGVDALLSGDARAEWRQRVAWSYYIENRDPQALAIAQTVSDGSGAWVAEGDWVAGLAAWRMGDCATAGASFERAAARSTNAELRNAAFYWASRSALRCRQPERSAQLLRAAAVNDETLYGMLAAEQLGRSLPDLAGRADFTESDWKRIKDSDNVRVAIALTEIGRDDLASQVLIHEAKLADAKDFAPLSRLARELGLPQTQLYLAYNAPAGASPDPAARYPAPKWAPVGGWQVDPALAFAHTLQESAFRGRAISPASAQGLMQITPITVREFAPRLGLSASQVDIFDPGTNLAFGQQNLKMLRDSAATQGELPKIMAAYNAGLSPVTRWNSQVNDQGDPLLYMESIPYWETRSYVATVMRNYWMYERQAQAPSATRVALAENAWPMFPDAEQDRSGRVYLSAHKD
uniref:lytic transglycosylase domain-containing protein n=1 Tax=Altererythrobacter segetis TaxID=1104773 RepID=UPI001FAEBDEA|nr:lytic transglycosylase domain-containing protein [Altererythrobacter segetis]